MPRKPSSSRITQAVSTAAGLACVAGLPVAGAAQRTAPDSVSLTVYSSAAPGAISPELYRPLPGQRAPGALAVPGYALVRQDRTVQLPAGRSQLRFTDVAALIDPTTVTFSSLSEPATRVLEQNFQFDLVSTDKLLQKYLDRPVTIERDAAAGGAATVQGTLLSSADGLLVRGDDGTLTALKDYSAVRFPAQPEGLMTRPTLVWDVQSPRGGAQQARVSYQTGGLTWWADYNLVFSPGRDAGNGFVDLSAWVSLINQSGASYEDARLKLVAGEVNRAQPRPTQRVMMAMARAEADSVGFEEKAFDEFHLYTLGRRTTLPDNSTKQVELFDAARKVPAQRLLVYAGGPRNVFGGGSPYADSNFPATGNTRVDSYLVFRNDRASGLGMPLPAGRIRVSRLDTADDSLEFIGEDVIGHTPRDETVRVKLGSAFDVVGERRQVDFRTDSRARWMEEEIEVQLRNHKDEAVEVQVREGLYRWSNWQVLSSTLPFHKEDAGTVSFNARVAANAATTLRYRVRYSW